MRPEVLIARAIYWLVRAKGETAHTAIEKIAELLAAEIADYEDSLDSRYEPDPYPEDEVPF